MPTYTYRCPKGHTFELFHGIKDDSPRRCPRCRRLARRVPAGGGGLLFKGPGFYATDHRSASYEQGAKSEKTSKSGKDAGGAAGPGKGGAAKPPAGD
jgi:putative FmdB family regulatory protein